MLQQSFKTADELKLSEAERSALMKTLVLLETDKLRHVYEWNNFDNREPGFSGLFNMNVWTRESHCGTVACIGGTAQLVGGVDFADGDLPRGKELYELFQPTSIPSRWWQNITPAQAAVALRSYLTTGKADWKRALEG